MIDEFIKKVFDDPEAAGEKGLQQWRYIVTHNGGVYWIVLFWITGGALVTAMLGNLKPELTVVLGVIGAGLLGILLSFGTLQYFNRRLLVQQQLSRKFKETQDNHAVEVEGWKKRIRACSPKLGPAAKVGSS